MWVDLGKLGDGADNRSRTYDLRITNDKNPLVIQRIIPSTLRSHVPPHQNM